MQQNVETCMRKLHSRLRDSPTVMMQASMSVYRLAAGQVLAQSSPCRPLLHDLRWPVSAVVRDSKAQQRSCNLLSHGKW